MTVDGGASAHDVHRGAPRRHARRLADDEFTSLQLQTGQLDPVSSGEAAAAAVGGGAAGGVADGVVVAVAPAPMGHFY